MSTYEDELVDVKSAPDDIFPDFLFNPVFNDFNDDYYRKSFANDDIMASIKRLRRRYGNYFQWSEAMDIYEEYMEYLVEKFGSMRVIKNAIHYDVMQDPVPAKPKLKMNKKNRQFMNAGVVPSEKIDIEPLSSEEVISLARNAFPGEMGETVDASLENKKLPKEAIKRYKRIQYEMEGRNRRKNLYRSTGSNAGTDFIVEYLNQVKRGQYNHRGEYTGSDDMTLTDIVHEQHMLETTPPELVEDPADNATIIKNGRLVNKKEEMRLEIYKQLFENGIDVIGAFGNSMDKKAVKLVRSYIGDTEPASKKELKKIRKRARKEQDRLARRADSNRLLEETLLGNRMTMNNDGSSLTFRLKDVYRDV